MDGLCYVSMILGEACSSSRGAIMMKWGLLLKSVAASQNGNVNLFCGDYSWKILKEYLTDQIHSFSVKHNVLL